MTDKELYEQVVEQVADHLAVYKNGGSISELFPHWKCDAVDELKGIMGCTFIRNSKVYRLAIVEDGAEFPPNPIKIRQELGEKVDGVLVSIYDIAQCMMVDNGFVKELKEGK